MSPRRHRNSSAHRRTTRHGAAGARPFGLPACLLAYLPAWVSGPMPQNLDASHPTFFQGLHPVVVNASSVASMVTVVCPLVLSPAMKSLVSPEVPLSRDHEQ